jgi:hypothetical protein
MSLVLGMVLFIVVLGMVDTGLPWPKASHDRGRS